MSATIQSIEAILVDIPTIRPHKLSMTTMGVQSMVIVRMKDSDGLEGLGEATTIGGLAYGPESPESVKLTIDTYFRPQLIGQPADAIDTLRVKLNRASRGNNLAKSAIETALLDLQGKRLNCRYPTYSAGLYTSISRCSGPLPVAIPPRISRRPSA